MEWHVIPTGRVWVDPGGAMGLVPKALWIEHQPLDEDQLVPMDLNSMLVFSEDKTIVIDTGIGDKLSPKAAKNWGLDYPEGSLLENLAVHGVSAEDVDIVISTHYHSDHCGGNTTMADNQLLPTFPNAQYTVQRMEFADAYNPDVRTRGTYLPENFVPVWSAGRLKLLHGDSEITSEVRCVVTRGHTRGHQSVILDDGENPPVLFVSDLASYALHLARASWMTAYDVEPLETIRSKHRIQTWALEQDAMLVFQHDTHTRLGKMYLNDKGRPAIETLAAGSIQLENV
jgi:glyoxylase-like metal-dependent hydrolase (beta-lactamase superfamily II)